MDDENVARLRRADFWTALVFLALAGLMLTGALGFPLTDDYAGVQNAWYVSPALFPLLVAGCLGLLSTLLLVNAIRTGGAAAALAGLFARRPALDAPTRKLALVALLLVGYVYGFVPTVDYVVGTVFFLLAFVAAFHLDDRAATRLASGSFLALSLTTAAANALGVVPAPGSRAALLVDGAVLVALALTALAMTARSGPARRGLGVVLLTSLTAPLVLAGAFRYGLLVPLPREGLVVGTFDAVRYALRGLGG